MVLQIGEIQRLKEVHATQEATKMKSNHNGKPA